VNGVPSDADLFEVITRGMVGSAMPPHGHLTVPERQALVGYVRQLTTARGMQRLLAEFEEAGDELEPEVAREITYRVPGSLMELPEEPEATPELLAEGRMLYVRSCAPCHDLDGTGRTRTDFVDSLGHRVFARDFTAGIMKGGTSKLDMYRRIRLGMPGTPMPRVELSPRETWALVHYSLSMIRPGAQSYHAQKRTLLTAMRFEKDLPSDPSATAWSRVPGHWIALTPAWWREPRIEGVLVQAASDGRSLALRLCWEDVTAPEARDPENPFDDAFAIRFSTGNLPPFYGPRRLEETVETWHWRAILGENQILPPGVRAKVTWDRGYHQLVLTRDLSVSSGHLGIAGGGEISLAFELLDGATARSENEKNVSIWHRLRLPF
jgi:DMSO reductase family type II enzyme heme b subunit